jgi:hypothetical protein
MIRTLVLDRDMLGVFVQCGFVGKLPSGHGDNAVTISQILRAAIRHYLELLDPAAQVLSRNLAFDVRQLRDNPGLLPPLC